MSGRPIPYTKSLARDDIVCHSFIEKKYVIVRYSHFPSDVLRISGWSCQNNMKHHEQSLGESEKRIGKLRLQ